MSVGVRIGHGFDLHRLVEAGSEDERGQGVRALVVGGVEVPQDGEARRVGVVAHSDGDVVLHALTDAVLGAVGAEDIGQLFPDDKAANDGRASEDFVREAVRVAGERGWRVANVDATVVLQRPRIGAVKRAMRERMAAMLGVGVEDVNVKGKSHEHVDAVGEGRAIAAHCVVLMERVG